MGDSRRYVFAPLEQRGVIAGLRAGQVGLLGGGLVIGTALLRGAPNLAGVGAAVVVLLAAVAGAFVPVGGRPVEQWAPVAARHTSRWVTGTTLTRAAPRATRRRAPSGPGNSSRRRHRSPYGTTRDEHGSPEPVLPTPPAFGGLVFDEVGQPGARAVGVVRDAVTGATTAVLAVRGRSFALLDAEDKERRLSSWSAVLAGLSREGGPVRSIQWVERTVPGDSEALVRHLDESRAISVGSAPVRSYAELVAEAGPLGQEHECFVALSVRSRRRRAPGAADSSLLRELRLLEGQLRSAEVQVDRALSERELAGVVRSAFDPWARTGITRRTALHPDLAGSAPAAVWPAATDEHWSWWRTDEAWHATFWVAEWPRSDVGPDFLAPLLLHTGGQRTVAVVMAPLTPSAGVREAEAARTAQAADEQLRQRAGFIATARRSREAEGIARRETELSDGHVAYRFSGYVTVTAADPDGLEIACGEVVQAAHQCRLQLRRLHGVQDLGFTWTLPLGRGLSGR